MTDPSKVGWKALCKGAAADEPKRVALELVRAINQATAAEPSITGEGGFAVLYQYADRVFPGEGFGDRYEERVAGMIEMFSASSAVPPALFGGFTGTAWVLEHTQPTEPDATDDDDGLSEIDEALAEALASGPWRGDYDLISGLVGFAVYALERGPRLRARECLRSIVDQLAALAHEQSGGVAWWTEPVDVSGYQRPGHYNLGVAHGVPGVVAVLAQMCKIPELAGRARPLLERAVGWLLAQRLSPGRGADFSFGTDGRTPARSAWCYGDPGIAPTLLMAGRLAGNPTWEQVAIEIGIRAAERPSEETGVVDAGICHGAAGLAHIYNRLYQATSEPAFGEAARAWLARTLAMRSPGVGLSGYLSLIPGDSGPDLQWLPDPTLLTGIAGIALVLMAAVTDIEPGWDRCLLCAVAPSANGRAR